MAAEPFEPIFGENGAVLNSPSMTPEMRAKFERSTMPVSRGEVRLATIVIALSAALVISMQFFGSDILRLLRISPWWAGAFSGALFVLLALLVGVKARSALVRWELAGPHTKQRRLSMPDPMRWLFAVVLICAWSAWSVAMFTFLSNFGEPAWMSSILIGALACLSFSIDIGIYETARRRGWFAAQSPHAEVV
jgi:hypothetical protein